MKLPNESFSSELSLAIDAVLSAGEQVMSIYKSKFTHKLKDDNEPVTQADIISDKIIRKYFLPLKIPVLSEETKDTGERLKSKMVWIVDPLDGTQDFIKKTGDFSIMISLVENGVPVLGVIYNPVTDVLYIAEFKKGAYKKEDGKWHKINVSNIDNLGNSNAVMSKNHLSDREKFLLKKLGITKFIQQGSAGLKIMHIACGEEDLYFTFTNKMKQWDISAPQCILREAGGKITDMNGGVLVYNTKDVSHKKGILVTNGILHNAIVDLYKDQQL